MFIVTYCEKGHVIEALHDLAFIVFVAMTEREWVKYSDSITEIPQEMMQ